MKKRGFSLIEMAIVLSIIGIIISGSLKAAKVMRESGKEKEAKLQVATAKEAIMGDALEYGTLSTVANFDQNLSPVAGNQKKMFYYPDSNLLIDICSYSTTKLEVNIYKDGNILRKISNVAFAIAAVGANSNLQTGMKTVNGKDVVNYYDYTMFKDDGNDGISRPSDRDDDPVAWATLTELQEKIGCGDKPFRFLNNRLPSGQVGVNYNATLYVENNLSPVDITCDSFDSVTFASSKFSGIPSTSNTYSISCIATENPPTSRIRTKQFVITIDPSTGTGTGSGLTGNETAKQLKVLYEAAKKAEKAAKKAAKNGKKNGKKNKD